MPSKREWERRDPDAKSEARKYAHPVPSRRYIQDFLDTQGVPMQFRELADAFELDREERDALRIRLKAMVRDGQIIRNRREGYCLVNRIGVVAGIVTAHRDGFGFVLQDDDDDIYLAPRYMRELFHGDRVAVRIKGKDHRGRPEGALVEVLERNTSNVVGKFFVERGIGFVVPENARITHQIAIPAEGSGQAKPGQIVIAEITEQPSRNAQPIGRITRVLGQPDSPGMEIEIAIHAHGLPTDWPDEVGKEAARFGETVPESAKDDRRDLSELPLLTIDGEDARDFDDAVFCEPVKEGWRLYVAIADVAHYVTPGSELDKEAEKRGTSVYFTRRVLPMLPEVLSNGLCSLNPEVDRLCMVCEMLVSRDGKVTGAEFYNGYMRSKARLTYKEVAAMLFEGDKTLRQKHADLMQPLENLNDVFKALVKSRKRRGAIDFEIPQAYVELGEDRRIETISTYERNDAHRIIEECMIAANVSAARFLSRKKLPTLYRVHDAPVPEKLEELRAFLDTFGVPMPKVEEVKPKHYAEVLERVKGQAFDSLVETVLLRSMARAEYQPANVGHFGLALMEYAHFTSPIRRYPDLLVHRAIKHAIAGKPPGAFRYSGDDMAALGKHCSMTERRADDATRDAIDWLKCEFMLDKVGKEFDGVITGVTGFGVFVQLTDFFVEGLIHISALSNDYYEFDRPHHRLVGDRSGGSYQLAQAIRIRVTEVDMEQRRIDFEPVEARDSKAKGGSKKRRRRR